MRIRFCLDDRGALIDSKKSDDLSGNCRVCTGKLFREKTTQLFQHSDKQCTYLVISEISERLSNLIAANKRLSIPIDYRGMNNTEVDVLHCSLLVDREFRPLIQLTITDNQIIYLSVELKDAEIENKQISELRQHFQSVIKVNLNDLIVPSTNFTDYLKNNVLDHQFHKRCSWLSFNPLHPLTNDIAAIETASIEQERQQALTDLGYTKKRLEQYKTSELLLSSTNQKLNEQVTELRTVYALGKKYIEQQRKEEVRLKSEVKLISDDIKNASWLKTVLARFDCSFGDIESELCQIIEILDSFERFDKQCKLTKKNLDSLKSEIEKKQKELDQHKIDVEYYNKKKFQLFRENQQLKAILDEGNVK